LLHFPDHARDELAGLLDIGGYFFNIPGHQKGL